ncbi:MAG: cation:proton antiporter [Thermomicrobiales bacterium]
MEDIRIIVNLFMALGFAVIGGLIARRLGLPVLVGYVLAGIVVGPNSPGLVADSGQVTLMANLGVAFLMFALGVEFSIKHLLEVRRVALIAASVQYPITFALGTMMGVVLGWSLSSSLLLGGVFVISSSIVMLKLLMSRGETTSSHARFAIGLGVIQDLSLVPLLALVPVWKEIRTTYSSRLVNHSLWPQSRWSLCWGLGSRSCRSYCFGSPERDHASFSC